MFNFLTNKTEDRIMNTIGDMEYRFAKEIKEIKEEIAKIDIKAMEAQRSYRAKLKRLTGDKEEDSETNKNPSIFLSPNGNII